MYFWFIIAVTTAVFGDLAFLGFVKKRKHWLSFSKIFHFKPAVVPCTFLTTPVVLPSLDLHADE